MSEYPRAWSVVVGQPGQPGRRIEGLRTTFDVTQTDGSEPNRGSVRLFNISEETAQALEAPASLLQLFAGYGFDPNLIFLGDITRAVPGTIGADVPTLIECGDGQNQLATQRARVAIKGATTLEKALGEAVKGFVKDPVKAFTSWASSDGKTPLPRGFSSSGNVRAVLRGLARVRTFDWFMLNGQLHILAPGAALRLPAVRLTPDTGLVGSPERALIRRQVGTTSQELRGVKLKALLTQDAGRLTPRRIVRVESRAVTGWFLARTVRKRGDSWGRDWYVEVEATDLEVGR